MQLGETTPTFSITVITAVIIALVSEPVEGNSDDCHVYYNFAANEEYKNEISQGVTWTTNPSVIGTEPCKKKGVISMLPPSWAGSAEISMTFSEDASDWIFNLGDSPHNNGYGGDGNEQFSTDYDAEIYGKSKVLSVYPNSFGSRSEIYNAQNAFNRWLVLKIQSSGVAAYSDTDLEYKALSLNLLAFGESVQAHERIWYLGVNRVINRYDVISAESGREGNGLCSVCIRWVQGQNLDPPAQPPVVAVPGSGTPAPTEPPKDCMETGTCKVCYDFNKLDHNSYSNNAASGVEWTMFPDNRNKPCSARSVMKITPPSKAKGAQISFTFLESRTGWLFNLGDSQFNNGYGQGGSDDGDNAEITANNKNLQVYKNTALGNANLKLFANDTAYNRWLVLKIRDGGVAAFSDVGLFFREYNSYLLQLSSSNAWYLGLNRVVESFDNTIATGDRYGEGLCSVCIEWNKDGNLDRPTTTPVPPPPAPTTTTITDKNVVGRASGENNGNVPSSTAPTDSNSNSNMPAILGPGPNSSAPLTTTINIALCMFCVGIVSVL